MTTGPLDVRRRPLFVRIGENHVLNAEEIALVSNDVDGNNTVITMGNGETVDVFLPFAQVVKILADWECIR